MSRPRVLAATVCSAVLVTSVVTAVGVPAQARPPADADVVVQWNEIAQTTVVQGGTPIPAQPLYFGFVSLAVHDAVMTATKGIPRRGFASGEAAAAVAAHDVLAEYFPGAAGTLAAELEDSLDDVADRPAKIRGIVIGHHAAARLIADRADDGRGDPGITFTTPPGVGTWRPTPPANAPFAVPWLGFVDPLLIDSPAQIQADGPDALDSSDYATDFNEVKVIGAADSSVRTPAQAQTAVFWNWPVPVIFQAVMRDMAEEHSLDIIVAAEMFAAVNASTADSVITCWRLKFDVGYWRPITAIHQAADDDNPATEADTGWAPLVATPPYPEYPSGHACLTGSYVAGLTTLAGSDQIDFTVRSGSTAEPMRHYDSAAELEQEAFDSRIWLGIHFRDAMEDGYDVGRQASALGFATFFG